MGARFATVEQAQTLHPYADKDCFFTQQWIVCDYVGEDFVQPGKFLYRAEPPDNWSAVDKKRANAHFVDFDIARRYGRKAVTELRKVLAQLRKVGAAGMPIEEIVETLLQPAVDEAPFVNHWQCATYQALAEWALDMRR